MKKYYLKARKSELTHKQKENVEEWCAALESGDFNQGKRRLAWGSKKNIHYCCLGVACEINQIPREQDEKLMTCWFVFKNGYRSSSLPDPYWMKDQFGWSHYEDFISPAPFNLTTEDFMGTISHINDTGHLNFTQIAKIIRAYCLGPMENQIIEV